jgi:hypothetical protein
METVNQNMILKSGDEFIYQNEHKVIYTLQKLPDFPLWILISEFNDMWMKPMNDPFESFGGCHMMFKKVID